jgi:hypothetical protein
LLKAAVNGPTSYAGDGSSGMYLAWAQCEVIPEDAPEEPTEYIPSVGSAATTVAPAFTLGEQGYFAFASAPPSGVFISWSGTFNYRVHFTHDTAEFSQFLKDLYEARKVQFQTDK